MERAVKSRWRRYCRGAAEGRRRWTMERGAEKRRRVKMEEEQQVLQDESRSRNRCRN